MNNERLSVALLYGGRGYESEVSLKGYRHILPLIEKKFRVLPIFIEKNGAWLYEGRRVFPAERGFISESGERIAVDCAIPLLHGDFGEDGRVQGALDCASIPYVGSDTVASAICRDKSIVKRVAESLGIPTLHHILLLRGEDTHRYIEKAEESMGYPMFVKPARLGSSIGAMAAEDRDGLGEAIESAFALCDRVIVEPCLKVKRELECGYFAGKSKELFTNPGEILINGRYGYEEKYLDGGAEVSAIAEICEDIRLKIREYSERLVRCLGVRDLCRVDFFLSGDRLYFNEINSFPGMTEESLYAKMLSATGIEEYEALSELIYRAHGRR